jgi:prolipoprotein diacylglyceryl transferase
VITTTLASIPSPSQGVWHLGPFPIRAYALFIIVGIIVALVIGDRRVQARGGEAGIIYDIALPAVIFGLIGGRLYHVITDWSTYFGPGGAGIGAALSIWDGGLGIWGAVALGGVGAWIGCRRKGIPLPAFGDAIAPGIVLAQAIGRLGNYFNQELFGKDTTLPWGLEIYDRVDSSGARDYLNGVSTGQLVQVVHPTFLYELLWNVLVFALLIWVDRRFKIGHGRLFALYVAAYCFGRFWIELMRSDTATLIAGVRINSFVSVFVFVGAVVYIMVAPKGREDPSALRGRPEEAEEPEDVEELAKELAAVASTTGVVAAAKVAGEMEDEDAEAAEAEAKTEEAEEPAGEKSAAEEPVAEEPAAEEPAEPEAAAEAEQLAEDVADAPAEEIAEAVEFAEAGKEAEATEPAEGLGAVEGEEAVEAAEAAPEVHEAAVEEAEEAAAVADEVVAGGDEGSEPTVEPVEETPEAPDESVVDVEQSEPETTEPAEGLGAVEGEEAVEAADAAPEVHEAAVEEAAEAAAVADEVATEEVAAPEPATEAEPELEAETEAEPAAEPETEPEPEPAAEEAPALEAESEPAEADEPESGGRVRRWLRDRRSR